MLLGYYRKFASYNFTVYETHTQNGFCFIWGENNGKRGANEICSNLLVYFKDVDARANIKYLSLYCDNCAGQNKNRQLLCVLQYFMGIAVNIEEISVTFLISGHTYMPVDSMHAVIEKSLKNVTVWSYNEWPTILRNARKHPRPYKINIRKFYDFYNWGAMITKSSKIKSVEARKSEIKFKYIRKITVNKNATFVTQTDGSKIEVKFPLKKGGPTIAYSSELEINDKKFKDLKTMCEKKIIENQFHSDYLNLKYNGQIPDVLADTDEEDDTSQ